MLASIFLLSSAVVEYTQPHPSRFTPVFLIAWLGLTVWAFGAIRKARA